MVLGHQGTSPKTLLDTLAPPMDYQLEVTNYLQTPSVKALGWLVGGSGAHGTLASKHTASLTSRTRMHMQETQVVRKEKLAPLAPHE